MEQRTMRIRGHLRWQVLWIYQFVLLWNTIEAQIPYTIPEELKEGSVVGNIAKDLGLGISEIYDRKLRIASDAGKQYFSVDLGKGELVVNERIDREYLCGENVPCLLPLEVIVENPLQLHRIEIEIQDINDNSPGFLTNERILKIAEVINPGAKFPLESAHDPDVDANSLRSYSISDNDHFLLNMKTQGGQKIPELVLKTSLDREKQAVHKLVLTAVDGGTPARSGTSEITVIVLDVNDNEPQFERPFYEISVAENRPVGNQIVNVKASDSDEGLNGEIEYFFADQTPDSIMTLLNVDSNTGEITIKGQLDYEQTNLHTFDIVAKDKGSPQMEGHCSVKINIADVNDNAPQIIITSLTSPIPENSAPGMVIALISAKDLDVGENGNVKLNMSRGSPFTLKPSVSNHYALVTNGPLDRETFPNYDVVINAVDSGSPPLSTKKTVTVKILDVNDNPPVFSQTSYTVYVKENGIPGSLLSSVSASDTDMGENAKISYSILDSKVQDVSVSSYIYINSDNGSIYSMHSFDYEKLKVFQIQVQAKDHGSPSLSSNVTVHVFILDQNDNAPAVIYPSAVMGSVSHQKMPRSAKAGHLTTKISAVDADSGHNAWISYRLVEATDSSLFSVNLYTGEVRTKRAVSEQDDSSQRLLIEIQDNGEPVQSATVTVNILLEDGLHEPILDLQKKTAEPSKRNSKITFYLIISLASVSVLSLLTFLILVVKCVRNSRSSSSCCIRRADSDGYKNPNRNLQLQLNTDGPIKYVEVLGGDMLSQSQSFRSCLSPVSEFSDFTLVKPSSTTDFKDMINVLDASLPDSAWTFESQQQKPPNNDWRFTQQGQRPGPSGQYRLVPHYTTQRSNNTGTTDRQNNGTYRYSTSTQQRWTPYGKARAGPHPEGAGGAIVGTGPWPNPPTEAEQLQALMAAANEVSEATATLGPRYNAQFPMQHVPDYRQNVYIPGSTATLTANPQQMMPQPALQGPPQAIPQVDVPNAAQTPASKKKSTKKDKK
ncbi:protocadherin gamma-C5 isoform X4 [Salmo salar]|uniref:Protocadherin gamma-C5 isoform X4 n=1 Tax=Salmo salar TaxID=8030 RepID=A0ABM3EPC2_SALSA|nr:protocadherin gamma-C5-like isoform X4 [Salmo salar]